MEGRSESDDVKRLAAESYVHGTMYGEAFNRAVAATYSVGMTPSTVNLIMKALSESI